MSFAAELAAANAERKSSPPPPQAPAEPSAEAAPSAPTEASPEAPKAKVEFSVEDMDFNSTALPTGTAPVKAEIKDAPAAAPEPKTPVIRVGGMEFKSVEDAIKYADELAIAKQQEEAYLQGFQKAKEESAPPPEPEKSIDEILEEKLFENPKMAIAELRKVVKEEIFADYNKMIAEQEKQRLQQETSQKLWGDFYKENPELSDPDTREFVQEHLLRKHWNTLQDLPLSESLPKLADMARRALRIKREDALPTQTLHSGPAIVPGASGNATASATPATGPKELDFVAQVNTLRRRSAK